MQQDPAASIAQTQDILRFSLSYITTGGYVAVGISLLFIAYFIRTEWKAAKWIAGSTGFVLIIIFAILNIISTQFPDIIVQRSNISVIVLRAAPETIITLGVGNDTATPPFRRKEYDSERKFDRHYFIAYRQPQQYSCLTLAVAPQDRSFSIEGSKKDLGSLFAIPVDDSDTAARRQIVIRLVREEQEGREERGPSKIMLSRQDGVRQLGPPQEITRIEKQDVASCEDIMAQTSQKPSVQQQPQQRGASLLGIAFAQGLVGERYNQQSTAETCLSYLARLRSDDPLVRRRARQDLAREGSATVPIIHRLLYHPSYQIQLGALVGLGRFTSTYDVSLPADVVRRVEELKASSDSTMRDAATTAIQPRNAPPSSDHLRSILWVDDMPDNNVFESDTLRCMGTRIVQATSTEKGVHALRTASFDLIISDMTRGSDGQAGLELLRELRAQGQSQPFIFYATEQARRIFNEAAPSNATFTTAPSELTKYVGQALQLPLLN